MTLSEIYQQFLADIKLFTWPEMVSTLFQVASVWYARSNNVLVYPTGIIGVLLAAYVYFFNANPPLYADGVLNIYYFLMSLYGWYNWNKHKDGHELYPISRCSTNELSIGTAFFIGFWFLIYISLRKLTNSNTPILDSLVSASAVTAMWWMAKRKIENWHAWIFSNIVAIPLNFYKGYMLFTLMYVLFLLLAWMGFIKWKKQITLQNGS